jgi:hypothetical protein
MEPLRDNTPSRTEEASIYKLAIRAASIYKLARWKLPTNAVKWLAAVKSTKRTLSRLSGDLVD